jgi:hypothetical protein
MARSCESRDPTVTVVVDPGALGSTVRAIRIDLLAQGDGGGSLERRFAAGATPGLVRLRAGAPGPGAELSIEVDTDDGTRRLRRAIDAPAGAVIDVRLGVDEAAP